MTSWIDEGKEERLKLAKAFAEGKIHNQKVVLNEYYKYFEASGKNISI